MFGFQSSNNDNNPSLALEINRISGKIPSSLLQAKTISILSGNVFSCNNGDKNLLPSNDPDRASYVCGSDSANFAMFAIVSTWILLVLMFLFLRHIAVSGGVRNNHRSSTNYSMYVQLIKHMMKTIQNCFTFGEIGSPELIFSVSSLAHTRRITHIQTTFLKQTDLHIQPSQRKPTRYQQYPMIYMVFSVCASLRRWLLVLFFVYLLVFLPAEMGLTMKYSTIYNSYIYLASASYLTGSISVFVMLGILLCFVLFMFSRLLVQDDDESKYAAAIHTSEDIEREKTIPLSINVYQLIREMKREYWWASDQEQLTMELFPDVNPISQSFKQRTVSTTFNPVHTSITLDHGEANQNTLKQQLATTGRWIDSWFTTIDSICSISTTTLLLMLFVFLNILTVFSVNMTFVYINSSSFNRITSRQKQCISVLVSIYKIVWNEIVERVMRNLLFHHKETHQHVHQSVLQGEEMVFYYSLLTVSIFNNIIAPCISMIIFSPNCFYYVFTQSKPIVSSYSFSWTGYSGVNPVILTSTGSYTFHAPFIYSDQCSSTLASDFSDVFLYRFLIGSWILPVFHVTLKFINSWLEMKLTIHDKNTTEYQGSWLLSIQRFIDKRLLPLPLRPTLYYAYIKTMKEVTSSITADQQFIRTFLEDRHASILNSAATIITDISIILTFGSVFPPLGLIGICSVMMSLIYLQGLLGRFLYWKSLIYSLSPEKRENHKYCETLIAKINDECRHFPVLLFHSVSTLWPIAVCYFWAFFQFDTYSDQEGTEHSFWVIYVMMIAIPGVIIASNQLASFLNKRILIKASKRKEEFVGDFELKNVGNKKESSPLDFDHLNDECEV